MKVYTFQLPKFLSSITRVCVKIFTKSTEEEKK